MTDRENNRIQVHDLEGNHLRSIGEEDLIQPSSMAMTPDGDIAVAELHARVTVLTRSGRMVSQMGHDPDATGRPGWPNALNDAGQPIRPLLRHGAFNSPHGIAVAPDGSIYVCEWLIGGRLDRLGRSDLARESRRG